MSLSRRQFTRGLGISAILAIGPAAKASSLCCSIATPAQPEGPFYPVNIPKDSDVDLTKVAENGKVAKGEKVIVTGKVLDEDCKPIAGAIVEIWQACHTGKYNHPSDTSDNALDPSFQYYGMAKTDKSGHYSFKTIIPGAYAAASNWTRPPHIHFKVSLSGYVELITQLYFAGEKLNKHDRILQGLDPDEKKQVTIDFYKDIETGLRTGTFNINLKSV